VFRARILNGMNDIDTALLAGLPSDVQALPARPPLTDTRLLEAFAHFQAALPLAQQAKDAKAIRDLSTRIFRLTRPTGQTMQRRQPRSRPPRPQRKGRR
jgi:hypothetical protein